jgi:hypothetical protein
MGIYSSSIAKQWKDTSTNRATGLGCTQIVHQTSPSHLNRKFRWILILKGLAAR